ncbi:MAG TPA: type II toxin-antitoxin system VapC family toxin [Rhodanobacteraceae bacterium]|nr:type II toxin-antitoxin system VapC family toxin [Rhodanobacteraceae bacterium]
MRLLLDTHILLWSLADPARLPGSAREAIEAGENEVLFSAASIWEIAIKSQVLRVEFGVDAASIIDAARETRFTELAISAEHAAAVAPLPPHHKDPFDRLLIAQALTEPARLVTADKALAAYSNDLVWLAA